MSLYGALFSGVSGLTAQSSAMGAISDNITNVSTVGFKNTSVSFQTLVTKQTSSTFYSAGGVQSRPLGQNDVQGLLQASTSQTDISISGQGYFVVNEVAQPGVSNQYLFTRAGSFTQDNLGYLKNTAGFYLQGWPTNASGTVIPAASSLTIANQNIISTDYVETINLSRVGGTATATTKISIGANLPSNDASGTTHKTDVQFFDTLGNANTISFVYTKSATANEWDLKVEPPSETEVLTIYTSGGSVYQSIGQLQFETQPATTAEIVVNGISYDFGAGTATNTVAVGTTLAATVSNLVTSILTDASFSTATTTSDVALSAGSTTTILFTNRSTNAADDIAIDVSALLSAASTIVTNQKTAITVQNLDTAAADRAIEFDSDGLPQSFNVGNIEILGFSNGAADMDNATANSPYLEIDFGTLAEANGMTQFGAEFTPTFIQQNGSRFGTFAGVTFNTSGLVTALFDNGETRPIFQVPIATFVNPNSLEGRTGNVWNSTEASGDYTLRVADNGPSGQVIQAALEASTVDIGEEFTNMIVVQRAYSAAAKIISTADEMLEELMRTKR